MSYGDYPADEQGYDTGQTLEAPPSYAGQPGYGQPGSMPPTYRVWGRVAFIGGALFGVIGLFLAWMSRWYSNQVLPLWEHGDLEAAVSASRKARAWLIASFVVDVLGIILAVVLFQQARSNYDNPSVVAASIKTQVQQRISDSSGPDYIPGVNVTSVVCTHAGTNIDHCVITLSNGETDPLTVTISGNGTGYSSS